ncbi:MAG: SDR family NAD(P)-dependent oxidoreductase [Bdellovibrio sp.]
MEIAHRQILITGAARGVGRGFAKMCAEEKASLHLVLRQSDPELVQELEALGAKSVTVWMADLQSRGSVEKLVEETKGIPIDILFNSVSQRTEGLLEEQSVDEIYQMMQINLHSVIHLTRSMLPGMLLRKRGKIINNSSVSAFMHYPSASTYAASKAAVAAFTDSVRLELKETGVSTLLLLTPGAQPLRPSYFQVPNSPVFSVNQYVQMIREAILHDLEELEPSGLSGVGLKLAKFAKPLFEMEALRRFKRL